MNNKTLLETVKNELYTPVVGDSIAVFSIEKNTKQLSLVEVVKTGGTNPRDFVIWNSRLFVANQDSDSIVIFHIDGERGTLVEAEGGISTGKPVCVVAIGEPSGTAPSCVK